MLEPRRLPPLNGVRAFEAAARTGAFTAAAAELSVTPAAVSRLVRLLEQRLGVTLFDRHANRLTPTPAGEAFRAGLTPLLDRLARLPWLSNVMLVSSTSGASGGALSAGDTFSVTAGFNPNGGAK